MGAVATFDYSAWSAAYPEFSNIDQWQAAAQAVVTMELVLLEQTAVFMAVVVVAVHIRTPPRRAVTAVKA